MDDQSKGLKSFFLLFSVIISAVIFLFTLFVGLMQSKEADFSMSGIALLTKNNPLMVMVILFCVIFPCFVYWTTNKMNRKLREKQEIIDYEKKRIEEVNNFTHELIHDNFNVEFHFSDENDILGKTFINLRDTLKVNKDNDLKQRKAEEQRNWLADGSDHFSKTLRNFIHDPDQLAINVIKDLTKYVNAVQGGFYVLDDSDPSNRFFNLASFFAFDRRKFADQKIKWGDGLIGTCALEKKSIYFKNVPDSYITVTSGLGEANPNSLIVAPMLYEDEIYGVIELASFNRFEPEHITLIEKTAESVGATMSAIKTNLRTSKLLEESKAQTQALSSHEEEMRQNMEELQATQEEALRQTQRLVLIEDALKKNIIQAEYAPTGEFISGNHLFCNRFEYGNDLNIQGKHIFEFISDEENEKDWFKNIWTQVTQKNQSYKGFMRFITRTGKDLWTIATLSAPVNEDKTIDKIILMGIDVTDEKKELIKSDIIIQSLENSAITFELDINGNLIRCNNALVTNFELSRKDLKSVVIFDLIHPNELEIFNKNWDNIINGNEYAGIIKGKSSSGKDVWVKGVFKVARNTSHETESVIFTGIDISYEKKLENELNIALETVKKQDRQIKDAEKEMTGKIRENRMELQNQLKEVEKSKGLLEKMLDETADAIILVSQNNRIILFNKAAEKLWLFKRDQVLNEDIGILFPESITEKDEILGSLTRPGDHKITGKRKKGFVLDKDGNEKEVSFLLTKARVENENAYMGFFQTFD